MEAKPLVLIEVDATIHINYGLILTHNVINGFEGHMEIIFECCTVYIPFDSHFQ